jgi:YD repeat-containing protein
MLTAVEAPNDATTAYVYDDLGNLLSTTSPDTGTTTYTYDAAGNRLSQTDATTRSDPKTVEAALAEAVKNRQLARAAALRALLKVIKRGGVMSFLPFFELAAVTLAEACAQGDVAACQTLRQFFPEEYRDLPDATCPPEA